MNPKIKETKAENLFKAILTLETVEECYSFFEDVCYGFVIFLELPFELFVESCRTLFLAKQPILYYTITKHFISVSLFDIISGIFGALPIQKSHAFPI